MLSKPYPPEIVDRVRQLHADGLLLPQIADTLRADNLISVSARTIGNVLKRHGMTPNGRRRWGADAPGWKGTHAKYRAFHKRVARARGKPSQCEVCGTTRSDVWYDWANVTGRYEDIADYKRMCRPCHRIHDYRTNGHPLRHRSPVNKKTHCCHGHPFSGDNLYVYPNGKRACRICKAAAEKRRCR